MKISKLTCLLASRMLAQVVLSPPSPPDVSISAPQSFGAVATGSSATQTLTVTNSGTQSFDMTAAVPAPFAVSPATFTLASNATQQITVTFTPTATPAVQTATLTVSVDGAIKASVGLIGKVNPYGTPAARLVCVLDGTTHAIVAVDGSPQCFAVPLAVDQAYQSFMLDTTAADADGNQQYVYANFWDFVTKYFVSDVLKKLDKYPPPDVASAKNAAAAAAAAADAAKAAILQGAVQQ